MTALSRRQVLTGAATGIGAALIAGCGSTDRLSPRASASKTAPPPGAGAKGVAAAVAQPLRIVQSQAERAQSFATVKRLDEHPLYEMTWWGQAPTVVGGTPSPASRSGDERPPFGCTLFAAFGDPRKPLIGRNFDWEPSPALVVHARPAGAARSLAVTDLTYYGLGPGKTGALDDPARRAPLERAPSLPFDGINEHGLFIGLAADEGAAATTTPGHSAVGGVGVQRLVLDRCRTVAQARTLMTSYNLDFDGGPALHYLIADRSGAATVAEFSEGALRFHDRPAAQPWWVLENFSLSTPRDQWSSFSRWNGCQSRLAATRGKPGVPGALDLLHDVKQGHTQWSIVYDLATCESWIYAGQRRDRVHQIAL
ncbi:carcinine hydrolase/isopenicillin-N N-acyltransferase family protein [Luteipulveratus mongoliensis]|uniref:carcinine hydrolase/isopenicillin-N N-acyltransferase family protein n=1 Tax=Luteipulveratus mongoliensis TaxID=571913 RepID=UPI000696B677|nr:carcinine hydrolase/isopenicillin-N N-acyltransferase family protein [Luteipulveratus mongoliensis]